MGVAANNPHLIYEVAPRTSRKEEGASKTVNLELRNEWMTFSWWSGKLGHPRFRFIHQNHMMSQKPLIWETGIPPGRGNISHMRTFPRQSGKIIFACQGHVVIVSSAKQEYISIWQVTNYFPGSQRFSLRGENVWGVCGGAAPPNARQLIMVQEILHSIDHWIFLDLFFSHSWQNFANTLP